MASATSPQQGANRPTHKGQKWGGTRAPKPTPAPKRRPRVNVLPGTLPKPDKPWPRGVPLKPPIVKAQPVVVMKSSRTRKGTVKKRSR